MAVQNRESDGEPTLLIVHGGWAGSWMWEPTLEPLRELGVKVEAIERLPSVGEDGADRRGLHADAEHVRERISAIGGPVAVCGHSYGGMVITEVADHPALIRSIYLAAFWPSTDQSLLDMVGGQLPDWIIDRGDGTLAVTPDLQRAHHVLFADLDDERAAWAHRQFLPQAAAIASEPARAPQRSHPVTYILCTQDMAVPLEAQEGMAAAADATIRLDSDHCPNLSHPDELARALAETIAA